MSQLLSSLSTIGGFNEERIADEHAAISTYFYFFFFLLQSE